MSFEGKGRKQQFEIACARRGFHVSRELMEAEFKSDTTS